MSEIIKGLSVDKGLSFCFVDLSDQLNNVYDLVGYKDFNYLKCLLFCVYLRTLGEEKNGEISVSISFNNTKYFSVYNGDIVKGYIKEIQPVENSITVVKSLGGKVLNSGSCLFGGDFENAFYNYFCTSEQNEIFFKTDVNIEKSICSGFFIQPLPDYSLKKFNEKFDKNSFNIQENLDYYLKNNFFLCKEKVIYGCDCNKGKVDEIIISIGEKEASAIILEMSEIKAICPYCKREYIYKEKDVKELFERK